jgi:DNA-binding transcriptional LysR family regulator
MIEKLRLFLVILEEGSLRRAAERLHISQSAITRQIQLLEHDLGGQILERTPAGVRPTAGGHTLAGKARSLLANYDSVMAEVRLIVRGESDCLRIGYIASAVQEYLGPALAMRRRKYPKLKVKMLDQTPGEMIIALRRGEVDLVLTGHGVDLLARDFYTHKLASVPSLVALPLGHPLADQKEISISQLKNESFVRGPDNVVPGFDQKIVQFCRRFRQVPSAIRLRRATCEPGRRPRAFRERRRHFATTEFYFAHEYSSRPPGIYSSCGNAVKRPGPCAPCWAAFSSIPSPERFNRK